MREKAYLGYLSLSMADSWIVGIATPTKVGSMTESVQPRLFSNPRSHRHCERAARLAWQSISFLWIAFVANAHSQ